jgi:peptidoglycan/xylan/chitin deacetylase (PgdA/CDA1 family)
MTEQDSEQVTEQAADQSAIQANDQVAALPVFQWPQGKRAAVSLTFDDARPSQIDVGLPILDRHGVKATFYLSPPNIEQRLEAWRNAAAHGHEMGNHTLTHPCTGNFAWSRVNALEGQTLKSIEQEIVGASGALQELVSVQPRTFAYPCGQKFVGRSEGLHSYVPLVARHFLAGRGFRDETVNAPLFCDLAQLMGVDSDDRPIEYLLAWVERAVQEGGWLVFCSHDVGEYARQGMRTEVLDALCLYCADPDNGIWIDTVANVADYIRQQQVEV